jgi:hypothetical protein
MRRPGFQPGREGWLAELIHKLEIAEALVTEALVMGWKYDDTSQDEHERIACAQEHLTAALALLRGVESDWRQADRPKSQDEHERIACAQEHLTAVLALLRGVESDWRQADRPKRCAVPVQGKNGEAYLCVLHDQHGGECSAYLPEKGGR